MLARSIAVTCFVGLCAACAPSGTTEDSATRTIEAASDTTSEGAAVYDSTLAAGLGADAYGMSRYVVAFLKAGPNRDQDSTSAARLQRAHLDNIQRLAREGSLVLAGPFLDEGTVRGLYVFDVASIDEARQLTESDPAIQAGRLEMELRPWYGTAALKGMSDLQAQITRESI